MSFEYRNGSLYCESVPLAEIAASAGTPCYVYSTAGILSRFLEYDSSFDANQPHTVCYAVKANSNLSVLRLLAQAGAGFDIVSAGELYRVLRAGGDPSQVVFSGVGKTFAEIDYALKSGIHSFNCESETEIEWISECATRQGKEARIALRVNPDVDAATHPYISTGLKENKFGIDIALAEEAYRKANALPGLIVDSVSCHIGSQILNPTSMLEAVDRVLALIERLRDQGVRITHVDLGGGLGIAYKPNDATPSIREYIGQLNARLAGRNLHVAVEPGRSLVAESGVLLSKVILHKHNGSKLFTVIDAAMNDLMRPALYQAHHEIQPVHQHQGRDTVTADIVGPVCESGDFLAKDRQMPSVEIGELLAIRDAGAYGFVMSSNYNSRPRAAEVLVDGSSWKIVRERETFEDLIQNEL
ncbi:diaminopimelate decarboxylase [Bryobacterales bacterium F-183]|nr:diaminopimelate decarboxylase [Bryobacterales bacterium F-183]